MMLPAIRLSDDELASSALDPATRLLAQQVFAKKGLLVIQNVFAPEFIECLKMAFLNSNAKHLIDHETDETLKVGDRRILVPIEFAAVFNTPQIYANPFVFPLVQDALGAECILGSFGAITALPGAVDQHVHRDHPFLFQDETIDTVMPAFAVNVVIPLVNINEYCGTTRVWPTSHRIWRNDEAKKLPSEDVVAPLGSCLLMDYRLLHRGTANHSEQARPILYLIYHRPWFKDYVNFTKVREIVISSHEHMKVPDQYKMWFRPRVD